MHKSTLALPREHCEECAGVLNAKVFFSAAEGAQEYLIKKSVQAVQIIRDFKL